MNAPLPSMGQVPALPLRRQMADALRVLSVDMVEAAKSKTPVYALGGVDEQNAEKVFATGIHGIAMMRAAWRKSAPL